MEAKPFVKTTRPRYLQHDTSTTKHARLLTKRYANILLSTTDQRETYLFPRLIGVLDGFREVEVYDVVVVVCHVRFAALLPQLRITPLENNT